MPAPRRRHPDLAQQVWMFLCGKAGVEPRLARHVWRKLERQTDNQALRYAFAKALEVGPPGSPARYDAAADLVHGIGSPGSIVAAIEDLVRRKQLSRTEANVVENCLLTLVGRTGIWK